MGIARIAKNVVTLGGHAKLVTAGRLYEEACLRHRAAHTQAQALKARADAEIAALGAETRKAMRVLRRAHSLLSVAGGYRPRLLSVEVSSAAPSLPGARMAAAALASYSSTGRLAAGAGIGSAAAAGSWALASLVGAASTGTAISALSGVAAYNATMAWFGGGALAAGGAGMAGGALVLTGIALAPMVGFAAWSTRSKARAMDVERVKVDAATAEALDAAERIRGMIPVAANARGVLLEERIALEAEERVARKAVWPLGRISRIWRAAKKAFGRAGLTEAETVAMTRLDAAVGRFSGLFCR